jgi:hypothetical protein
MRYRIIYALLATLLIASGSVANDSSDSQFVDVVQTIFGVNANSTATTTILFEGLVGPSSHNQNIGSPCQIELSYAKGQFEFDRSFRARIGDQSWTFNGYRAQLEGFTAYNRYVTSSEGRPVIARRFKLDDFSLYGFIDISNNQIISLHSTQVYPVLVCQSKLYNLTEGI